tara:strand:+ start:1642 stop:1851 length:210 start_codon:yes stop_codon:yes gene_type:complete
MSSNGYYLTGKLSFLCALKVEQGVAWVDILTDDNPDPGKKVTSTISEFIKFLVKEIVRIISNYIDSPRV